MRLSILLADDHDAVVRGTWRLLEGEFDVRGAVTDGSLLVETAAHFEADVIVLDVGLPELTGIEAARELRQRGCRSALVFLSIHQERSILDAALEAGATGYVFKTRAGEDLVPAVRAAARGERFVSH